jgi:hypothetical protein
MIKKRQLYLYEAMERHLRLSLLRPMVRPLRY